MNIVINSFYAIDDITFILKVQVNKGKLQLMLNSSVW